MTGLQELKQGYVAQKHAVLAAKNLKLLIKGAKDSKLCKYRGSSGTAMVALGKKTGVVEFPIATISGFLPGMARSRDLFVSKTRKQLGLDS